MKAEPTVRIVGPEGTALEFPLAGYAERVGALVADFVFMNILLVVVLLAMLAMGLMAGSLGLALGIVAMFAVRHGYFLFFETWLSGSTPGKRMAGLRVVSRDGGRLRTEAILARNLMRDLEMFVPLALLTAPEALIGAAPWYLRLGSALWAVVISAAPLYTKERVRAGDLLGGTLVVRIPKPALGTDPSLTAQLRVVFTREQLGVYGEHELETLAAVLRDVERNGAEADVLRPIALTIQRRIGFEGAEPASQPLAFLRAFYKAQRAALEERLVLGHRKKDKFDARRG